MIDRLELAAQLRANSAPDKLQAISQALNLLLKAKVVDPGKDLVQKREQLPVQREFSQRTREALERNCWLIYDPFDTSLNWLEQEGKPFRTIVTGGNFAMKTYSSRPSQVAILPDQFYVPNSNLATIDTQRDLMAEDLRVNINGQMGIDGVDMILGDAATHAGLVFAHLERTGIWLHLNGQDGERYIRTDTHAAHYHNSIVGGVKDKSGLALIIESRKVGRNNIFVARLLVPANFH